MSDRRLLIDGNGGRAIVAHLSPGVAERRPLLVYATGDRGWAGKDRDTFDVLVALGYPAIGFSSPEYLKHLPNHAKSITPAHLARDYATMIESAKTWLGLPAETRAILVGVSRGADLSVAAAGQRLLQPELGGVVAVALTKEEEYVRRRVDSANAAQGEPQMLELYAYLPSLGDVPVSVIQSTHDDYLPADAARVLFGPDGARRQLHAIEARDHSFSGARPEMYDAVEAALEWIEQLSMGR
ncbi:MAG TPA: AcvB/VirJ family lysyl-phosphatidylglycerol hydrolase [Vicinamibacterales bacterium]|nr:AcvB/VirJ family lysyl-phosphatidylglycerol hydrolase [Vicinamibacterales bacterium]